MRQGVKEGAYIIVMALAGHAAARVWGGGHVPPSRVVVAAGVANQTSPRPLVAQGLSSKVWIQRAPWGRPPKAVPPPLPVLPPPPLPIAIVAQRGRIQVVFLAPGGTEFAVKPGQHLPGGGRLVAVKRFEVTWIDRDGRKQIRELMQAPVAPPVP